MALASPGMGQSIRLPALDDPFRFSIELEALDPLEIADVASVLKAVDDLSVGALWGVLTAGFNQVERGSDLHLISELRQELEQAVYESKTLQSESSQTAEMVRSLSSGYSSPIAVNDDWEASSLSAANEWLKRSLLQRDPGLYNRLFSISQAETLEHSSPLVIVIVLAPAAGIAGAAWVAANAVRWIYRVRKERAETRSAEAQTRIDQVRARLVEQAEQDLEDQDPEVRAAIRDRVMTHLLPPAETLIEHPSVKQIEILTDPIESASA